MKKFYFTFGYGQYLLSGKSAANCYIVIDAVDEMKAREIMCYHYGSKWSMCYSSADEFGIEKYNLRQINLGE